MNESMDCDRTAGRMTEFKIYLFLESGLIRVICLWPEAISTGKGWRRVPASIINVLLCRGCKRLSLHCFDFLRGVYMTCRL